MNSMKLNILALGILLTMAASTISIAEEKSDKGFDYNRGKLEGRATIAGRVAMIQITGDAAESMYYQMTSPIEKDIGCTAGRTKQFHGMSCTNYKFPGDETPHFECWITMNLKTGNPTVAGEACPDIEYDDPYWDARGNKAPRVPDFTGLQDKP